MKLTKSEQKTVESIMPIIERIANVNSSKFKKQIRELRRRNQQLYVENRGMSLTIKALNEDLESWQQAFRGMKAQMVEQQKLAESLRNTLNKRMKKSFKGTIVQKA